MFNKIKQLKDLRDQGKQMKAMLDDVVIIGRGAGGKVMVTVNGSHDVLGVQIDDDLDRSRIAGAVKDAMSDANKQLQVELMKKMKEMGGLDMFKNLGM